MGKLLSIFTAFMVFFASCSEPFMDDPLPVYTIDSVSDAQNLADTVADSEIIEDSYSIWTDPCVECAWYFCPQLGAIWQKRMCFDRCQDPPLLVFEGECEEYLECDPTQYDLGEVNCVTDQGYPGTQKKVCNKGHIQYTNCTSDCEEEVCDGVDNDCDGEIDEGQLNACGECGIEPPEVCDGIDNNCNGDIDEDLIQPCYTACGSGYETCQNGNWISCTAPPEMMEVCDGLDNDCDGQIDEGLTCECTIQDVGVLFPCNESPLLCGQGFKTCECVDDNCQTFTVTECHALCHYYPDLDPNCNPLIGMPLQEELCNNFDDNCNQKIDEDLFNLCYTGPVGTLSVGICNGIDDDCDGITDSGEELQETDILFIVDWSGSMDVEISAVLAALNKFAKQYSDEDVLKWGLIIGPRVVDSWGNQNYLEMVSNLAGFSDFVSSFITLNGVPMGGQYEMLYDAVYLSIANISGALKYGYEDLIWPTFAGNAIAESQPSIVDFKINWRPNAKRVIIVFSDEIGQSYLYPITEIGKSWNTKDTITQDTLITAVTATPDLKVYTFTDLGSKDHPNAGWAPIANASGGKWYILSNSPAEMYNYLMEIIDENACSIN